jgi:hypothetical protein
MQKQWFEIRKEGENLWPAAGQTSRRQHGSQKRLVAASHQVILSASHGYLRHLRVSTICCFSRLCPPKLQSIRAPCGKPVNIRRQTHTYLYQEGYLMAPRLLERFNVPPPGRQSMGSGGPGLEKMRWSMDLWSLAVLEGGGLGVRSWG